MKLYIYYLYHFKLYIIHDFITFSHISLQTRRLFHDTQQGIILSNRTLVIQNTNLNHSGEYTCKADNKVGKSTSNIRFLNIKRKHRT